MHITGSREWHPTKYAKVAGKWTSSTIIPAMSQVMASCQASAYEKAIVRYTRGDLVDLGCGKAPLYGLYRDFCRSTTWIDWNTDPAGLFKLDVVCDLSERLPIPNEAFDTALLMDVIEHIQKPEQLLMEVRRIMRNGGICIMGVPFFYWIHEEPYDFQRLTRYKIKLMFEAAGFAIESIEEVGGALDVWSDLTVKILALSGLSKFAGFLVKIWRISRKIPLLQRLNQSSSKRLPLGYIVVAKVDNTENLLLNVR